LRKTWFWLRLCIGAGASLGFAGCGHGHSRPLPSATAPNVLVFVTDDERSDQMDVMPAVRKAFAAGGTTFSHAFDETPQCCPSRASIFSGRMTHNHGVVTNTLKAVSGFNEHATIERYLQEAGYNTAIVGKYFNEWKADRPPLGFDRYAIMLGQYPRGQPYTAMRFAVDGKPMRVHQYSTDFVGDQAVRMLEDFQRDGNRPWFLYVAPLAPHFPYTPAPQDAHADVGAQPRTPAVAERDLSDKPSYVRTYPKVSFKPSPGTVWRAQRRTLLSADRMFARVLARASHSRRSTLMFFISDNGYLLGEHGVSQAKRLPYRESVQVPMYMRWPGHVRAGAVDDRLVLNADIAPTIASAARLRPPRNPPFDGRSLLGSYRRPEVLLEQPPEKSSDRGVSEGEPAGLPNPSWASIWTPGAQYTEWYNSETGARTFREFYDLRRDRWQLRNQLAKPGARADRRVAGLARELAKARTCRGTSGANPCP
jgi:arylsulfatase A-like enzyme